VARYLGEALMSITVEAVYENGVLKPVRPLPLRDHEKVSVTVEPQLGWAEQTAGMIKWTGDSETLERAAIDPEFDPQESA
jgi:predicted DNA-binding antitoxin AbrB/MazE fold protein